MKKIILFLFLLSTQGFMAQDAVTIRKNNEIFSIAEIMPQFPGGDSAMYVFIANNISYPDSLLGKGFSGKVYVQFVVEEDGRITNVKTLRSPHDLFTKEAEKMMAKMPIWIPGTQNGKAVRTRMVLPVHFKS